LSWLVDIRNLGAPSSDGALCFVTVPLTYSDRTAAPRSTEGTRLTFKRQTKEVQQQNAATRPPGNDLDRPASTL
jgi:hypothetical protein